MRRETIISDPCFEISKDFLEREEFWKAIPGFENYEISTHGRLRKYLKCTNRNGYTETSLSNGKGKVKKTIDIHKLVMETFIGPPPRGHNINHKDGNKINPRLDNLEYVTFSENSKHAVRTGLLKHKFKITNDQVKTIKILCEITTQREVAKIFGLSWQHVSNIVLGKRRNGRV